MKEINIYGVLNNATPDGVIAKAEQIKDSTQGKKQSDINADYKKRIETLEAGGGTGSGGTTDYNDLTNKPQINGHELSGNQSSEDLGLQQAGDYALKSEIPDTGNFATKEELNNITPTIGENGNWFINGEDTGKPANGKDGADGVSLGEIALVQETGTEIGSENKVMSQKAVSEKLTELSDQAAKLEKESVKKNSESEQSVSTPSSFKICDREGRVLLKVDEKGSSSTAYLVYKEGTLVGTIDSEFFQKIITQENGNIYQEGDSLKICDREGKVFCIISSNGIRAINFLDKEGNSTFLPEAPSDSKTYGRNNKEWIPIENTGEVVKVLGLEGYELFSLCDSLGQSGRWQKKFSEITGCTFDQEKNIKAGSPLSVGGTKSYGQGFDSMMWRARNLILSHYIKDEGEKAIIILENINDASMTTEWDSSSKLLIPTQPIEGYSFDDFNTDMLNKIPSEKRILNACLSLAKSNVGKNLAITKLPEKEGDITLKVGWAGPGYKDYNIHVIPQDSDEETRKFILDKILEYDYTGVIDVLSENGESIDFSNSTSYEPQYRPTVIFTDTTGTGMNVSITDTDDAKTSVVKYFIGDNIETDWSNIGKWIDGNETTFSMGWKSTIEQLLLAYPKAHIFVSMFPLHAVTAEDFRLPNGYFDTDRYNKESRMNTMRHHQEVLKGIANFYSLPFINVFESCGIGITNMLTYYQQKANVHPMDSGYDRFGETVAGLVKSFF